MLRTGGIIDTIIYKDGSWEEEGRADTQDIQWEEEVYSVRMCGFRFRYDTPSAMQIHGLSTHLEDKGELIYSVYEIPETAMGQGVWELEVWAILRPKFCDTSECGGSKKIDQAIERDEAGRDCDGLSGCVLML
jgi:hypothetical protein